MGYPAFWLPHVVSPGDTLTSIAAKYGYANPGPIIAFNAEHLPDSIESMGGYRALDKSFATHSKQRKALGGGNFDPNHWGHWERLGSNQITKGAIEMNNPGMLPGAVATIRKQYPITEPLLLKTRRLEIPWTRKALKSFVKVLEEYIKGIIAETHAAVNEETGRLRAIKTKLMVVDVLVMGLTLGWGAAREYRQIAMLTEGDALLEVFGKVAFDLGGLAWDAVNSPQGQAATQELPKRIKLEKDLDYFINNSIGLWSPSKITAMLVGIKESDSEVFWWGTDAVDARAKNEIIDAAEKDIDRKREFIRVAANAAAASFYDHKVTDGPEIAVGPEFRRPLPPRVKTCRMRAAMSL